MGFSALTFAHFNFFLLTTLKCATVGWGSNCQGGNCLEGIIQGEGIVPGGTCSRDRNCPDTMRCSDGIPQTTVVDFATSSHCSTLEQCALSFSSSGTLLPRNNGLIKGTCLCSVCTGKGFCEVHVCVGLTT